MVRRLKLTYRFIANNSNKPSRVNPGRYKAAFATELMAEGLDASSQGDVDNLEYLKLSYPSLKDGSWNTQEAVTDLQKYGA